MNNFLSISALSIWTNCEQWMFFFSRTAFAKKKPQKTQTKTPKKPTTNHLGIPCTLKCFVRDATRLKAQSEGTESNCSYRNKRFSFLILLISVKLYLYKISWTEEALLSVAETKPCHKEYCVPKNFSHRNELINWEFFHLSKLPL